MNKGCLFTVAAIFSIMLSGCADKTVQQVATDNSIIDETQTEAVTETEAALDTEVNTEQTEDGQPLEEMIASLQDSVYSVKYQAEKVTSEIDYSQNVIENEDEFILWTPEQLENVRWYHGKVKEDYGMPVFTPIEVMDGIVRCRAIRNEEGLYIIVKSGGVEIWKDGNGVRLTCGRPGPVDVVNNNEIWFQDVTGSGSDELLYKTYKYEMGEAVNCIWIIDLEHMEAIEIEQDDNYFIEALKNFVENYENNGGSYVDGYEFFLSDKLYNTYNGLRFYIEDDYPLELYHEISIIYSNDRNYIYHNNLGGKIRVFYRYDENMDSFVVDRVETYRYDDEGEEQLCNNTYFDKND